MGRRAVKPILTFKDMYVVNSYQVKKRPFEMIVNTALAGSASDTFILPTFDVDNISVDWGDGNIDNYTTTGNKSHTYASAGIYTIKISGSAGQAIRFNNTGDKAKVLEVVDFGDIGWTNASQIFYGCNSLTKIDTSNPLWCKDVTSFANFAFLCSSLTTFNVSNWSVGNVTDFTSFVRGAKMTTLDVENWDVSSAITFDRFALSASNLTYLPVQNWNTALVQAFNSFVGFAPVSGFNPQNWDISSVTNLTGFAANVTIPTAIYDQVLIKWEAQSVTSGLSVDFGKSKYTLGSAAETARASLIANDGWSITDLGGI